MVFLATLIAALRFVRALPSSPKIANGFRNACCSRSSDAPSQYEQVLIKRVISQPVCHRLDDRRDSIRARKNLSCPWRGGNWQSWGVIEIGDMADRESG